MDLLNMLSGLMTSSSSINALSQKAGTNSTQTKGIVDAVLPILVDALTKNASSKSGASSLLGALQQHRNTSSIKDQIANADAEDGAKIIRHILGDNRGSVLQSISRQTGAETGQIDSLLSNLAPGLMSSLSAASGAVSARQPADMAGGLDLSGLLGILGGGGNDNKGAGDLGGLLGGLLESNPGNDKKNDGDDSLLSAIKSILG